MRVSYTVQTSGSALVLGAFILSETFERLLTLYPGSYTLWTVHGELFRPFHTLRLSPSAFAFVFQPWALWAALALLVLVAVLHLKRVRLGIAVLANLSALAAAEMAYRWAGGVRIDVASLDRVGSVVAYDGALIAILCAVSIAAAAASHVAFLRSIKSEC
jgi:hypothetical protein